MIEATTENQFLVYSGFFFAVLLFSVLINTIMLRFAHTLGIRDQNSTVIRWSKVSKPSLGGFSFYIAFLLSITTYSAFFSEESILRTPHALGLVGATSISFLMGLADDAYDTRPLLKLFIQVLSGSLLVATGNYIHLFELDTLNYLLTVLWVVAIMNSINMLDNMDGITSVVSIAIFGIMMSYMVIVHGTLGFEFMVIIGVIASLIGFLFYNWYPSKMFMGDTGSQFLGIVLAALSIKLLWNANGLEGAGYHTRQVSLVLVAFSLPMVDTITVIINRIKRGQSPFVGGKDHTTHSLSSLGLDDSQVGMVFSGLSLVNVFLCIVIMRFIAIWETWYIFLFIAYFLLLFLTFFSISQIRERKLKKEKSINNE